MNIDQICVFLWTSLLLVIVYLVSGCSGIMSSPEEYQAYYDAQSEVAKAQARIAEKPTATLSCTAGCSVNLYDPSKTKIPVIKAPTTGWDVANTLSGKTFPTLIQWGATAYGMVKVVESFSDNIGGNNTNISNHIVSTGDANPIEIKQNSDNTANVTTDNITDNHSNNTDDNSVNTDDHSPAVLLPAGEDIE